MRARFWGTRGSIPAALTSKDLRRKLVQVLETALARGLSSAAEIDDFIDRELTFSSSHTFGGNSPCVELLADGAGFLVCDMGSGARAFGNHVMAHRGQAPPVINIFMSHLHLDHIMGFPFFAPAHEPSMQIRIHGCHDSLEHAFRLQQSGPLFPVPFSRLSARVEFVHLIPGEWFQVGGVQVQPMLQHHSGDSYGYRFEQDGRSVVYSTDSEHKLADPAETAAFVEFFRDADLVIFDAMYSLLEAISVKEDWGHSSNVVAVELAQLSRVKHLCLFHHEPANDDEQIAAILRDAIRLEQLTRTDHAVKISAAWDGLEIDV
ncbi:MAG: MBL fold metallo-hydrolase [Proteobacteria bacterium]|nr:MAG: MBL fold metallo-hydrolase [Pseudomonadota bacterium]